MQMIEFSFFISSLSLKVSKMSRYQHMGVDSLGPIFILSYPMGFMEESPQLVVCHESMTWMLEVKSLIEIMRGIFVFSFSTIRRWMFKVFFEILPVFPS